MKSKKIKMNLVKFKQLLQEGGSPPQNMSDMRKALWYDSNGNWHRAHTKLFRISKALTPSGFTPIYTEKKVILAMRFIGTTKQVKKNQKRD